MDCFLLDLLSGKHIPPSHIRLSRCDSPFILRVLSCRPSLPVRLPSLFPTSFLLRYDRAILSHCEFLCSLPMRLCVSLSKFYLKLLQPSRRIGKLQLHKTPKQQSIQSPSPSQNFRGLSKLLILL
ncbi:hypothetical protein H6P81_010639 [Aristolochia fimbriata]|uniref:Uncharacterized protein n=1 Tax=Aristolochia fimbriata TaxID=158543 RepID=A0AAV7EQ07_ARIFI|nr:hypothetical protein H6P81_010639 [Aristolochia fimbriata]